MRVPFLVGRRLYLRPLQETDLNEGYLGWLNDSEVTRYLAFGRFPVTDSANREYLRRFFGSTADILLAIVDIESDQHIGNVTLNRIDWIDRTADTGIMIGRKDFWGRGYATEAWTLLIRYAFERLGLHKIIAGSTAEHTGSLSALKKLGFQREGILRGEIFLDGKYHDVIRMGLFVEEFIPAFPPDAQEGETGLVGHPVASQVKGPS